MIGKGSYVHAIDNVGQDSLPRRRGLIFLGVLYKGRPPGEDKLRLRIS